MKKSTNQSLLGTSHPSRQLQKHQQRLHREILKLTRLRSKARSEARSVTRIKLRLGRFLFVVNWQYMTEAVLETRLAETMRAIENPENEEKYRTKGERALRALEGLRSGTSVKTNPEEDEHLSINQHQTNLGARMMKHSYHRYPTAIILGALLEKDNQELKRYLTN